MESFVLSRKDCRNVYWRIYFLIVQLVAVNFILAWIITYVNDISIWFDDYSEEDNNLNFTFLFWIWYLLCSFLSVIYSTGKRINAVFKMTFIHAFILSLASYTHMHMRAYGWKDILICCILALLIMGLAILTASVSKKDYRKYYEKLTSITVMFFFVYMICYFLDCSFQFWLDCCWILLGSIFTFFETQDVRFNLASVRNQRHLDNLLYPFIMNLIGNFFLMVPIPGLFKIVTKYLVTCRSSIRK